VTSPLPTPAGGPSSPARRELRWKDRSREWLNGYNAGYSARPRSHGRSIRWGANEEPQMQCPDCAAAGGLTSYWPLTSEFWDRRNMSRCRACNLARKRRKAHEAYWADPETERQRAAEYSRKHHALILLKKRLRYAEDPAKDNARSREYREANRDARRAYARAYYARNRAHILLREKLRRAMKAAA